MRWWVKWQCRGGAGVEWLMRFWRFMVVVRLDCVFYCKESLNAYLSFIVIMEQTLTEDRCDMIVFAISFSSE